MKLIFCPSCKDVRALGFDRRTCACGKAWGYYHECGKHATIGGGAIPLGFENRDFFHTLGQRPAEGQGYRFQAFVIPKVCNTITEET